MLNHEIYTREAETVTMGNLFTFNSQLALKISRTLINEINEDFFWGGGGGKYYYFLKTGKPRKIFMSKEAQNIYQAVSTAGHLSILFI